ncbi:hypothetical protein J2S00_000648 [Caldalkalibacillus uzonensis]|uniref:Sporulation membrane protein YtrI C-terminal domain-containing protein n=1 Tax=Caldalkalibacillus uzonensis TaxID=353224 RepID=A0ABU0CN75_9BACI|nr:hypothetical protein [Caldalkalibacillus uzonensis]MDQ0337865.1 hypothetical protein [Caldalkalibacillus uzonensis]
MKPPHPAQTRNWGRLLVSFILGMLLGALIFHYLHAHTLDKILFENRRLVLEITDLRDEVDYLEKKAEDLNKLNQEEITVKKVEIVIVNEEEIDGFTATDIIERLREELKYLVKEDYSVQSVAETAETHARLIDGKTIKFENNDEYEVKLHSMIIHTTITIKIHVHKIS